MDAKELIKKKALYLLKIKERESRSPSENEIGDWDLDNADFDLSVTDFDQYISELKNLGIINLIDRYHAPEFAGITLQKAYDEDGNLILSPEVMYFYDKVNLEKLNEQLKGFLSTLTPSELLEVQTYPSVKNFGEIIDEGGGLRLHKGGLISYKDKEVDLRSGLKTLCEVFIDRPNQLIDRHELEDQLGIHTRDLKNTIAKYVSALNTSLEPHFGRKPIENRKKTGWIFIP